MITENINRLRPGFQRQQMLTQQEHNVDAVILTHEHNDHVIGLDDMRPIIFRNKKDMPIYCRQRTGDEVKTISGMHFLMKSIQVPF